MRKLIYWKLLTLLMVGSCLLSTQAANITVNPGESIQSAVDQANAGDVILVKPGTYTQTVLFSGSADSGTSGSPITLKADGAAGTVIISGSGLSPSGRQGLITVTGASYVIIDGFVIRDFATTNEGDTPVGIYVNGTCDGIQILNNEIYNIQHNKTNCTQNNSCFAGAHGIGVFGTTTGGITDILIQGNEVRNCTLLSSEAFVLNSNVDGFQVYDNIVHDNNNIGFDFIGYEPYDCGSCTTEQLRVRNGVVSGNTAYKNSSGSNPWYTGDTSAGGFYVDGGRNIVFAGNISYENDFGFEFASEWNNRKTEDILMVNNVVYNNSNTGLIIGGYSSSTGSTGGNSGGGSAENIYVYNNAFYDNQKSVTNVSNLYATEITFQYRASNNRFFNNIIYTRGGITQAHDEYCTGNPCTNGTNTNNTWGYNIWYGDNGTTGSVPGSNNVIQNPNYVAPATGNLNVSAGSPAINAGSSQSNLTDWNDSFWTGFFYSNGDIPAHGTLVGNDMVDLNGELRFQQSSIDIGAYEAGGGQPGGGNPPAAPNGLSASAVSASSIDLSWTDNSADEDEFEIEQSLTGTGGWSQAAVVSANSTSTTITGLAASTTYYFRVRANNTSGSSSWSATSSATTQSSGGSWVQIISDDFESGFGNWNDGGADARRYTGGGNQANSGTASLAIQDNTSTSVITTDQLNLSAYDEVKIDFWYYPVSMDNANEDFWLQISVDDGPYVTKATWARNTDFQNNTAYTESVEINDVSLSGNVKLRFRCDASGNGDDVYIDDIVISAKSTGGTPSPPSAPSGLNATAASSSSIDLSWTDNSNNEDDFQIQRSLTGTGGWSQVSVTSPNATSFTDTGLSASTDYYYRVRARNTTGNSSWSGVSSATTQSSGTTITIDGNDGDWSGISVLATNGGTSLKVYDDTNDIYFLLTGTLDAHSLVFINADNNSSGYTYSWGDGGLDYYVEDGNTLYDYTGSGTNWSWSAVSGAVTGDTSPNVEFKVSKSSLSGLSGTIKVGVSIENSSWSQTNTVPSTSSNSVSYVLGSAGSRIGNETVTELDHRLEVYPNPATDEMKIVLPEGGYVFVEIVSLDGKVLSQLPSQSVEQGQTLSINTSGLPRGLAIMRIINGSSVNTMSILLK